MANVSNPESRGYSSAEAHISRVETHKSLIVDALTKLDVRSEAEKRADWVVNAALDSIGGQLDEIRSKNNRQAKQMIKKMVNTVSPGSYYDGINYCIGAVMYNYKKFSSDFSDFSQLLPKEGKHNGLWCEGFINAMRKEHKDRVKKSNNLARDLLMIDKKTQKPCYKPGTLVFVKNGDSYHALTFEKLNAKGQPQVISFNNNHRTPLKNWSQTGYIVDVRGIISDGWMAKLEKSQSKLAWVNEIYNGRETELRDLIKPERLKTFNATPQMFAQVKLHADAVRVEKIKPVEIRSEANYRKISRITKYKKLARSKIKKELKKFSTAQILAMVDKKRRLPGSPQTQMFAQAEMARGYGR